MFLLYSMRLQIYVVFLIYTNLKSYPCVCVELKGNELKS